MESHSREEKQEEEKERERGRQGSHPATLGKLAPLEEGPRSTRIHAAVEEGTERQW